MRDLETWEPSQYSLVDRGKRRKTCVEVAGRRTLRILTSSQLIWGTPKQYVPCGRSATILLPTSHSTLSDYRNIWWNIHSSYESGSQISEGARLQDCGSDNGRTEATVRLPSESDFCFTTKFTYAPIQSVSDALSPKGRNGRRITLTTRLHLVPVNP